MNSGLYLAFTFFLIASSLAYFKVARIYKIVDLPNHRTMHDGATIRGGGIVIPIAIILCSVFMDQPGFYFIAGLATLGVTGFLDDIIDLSSKARFPLQFFSIILIVLELNLLSINPLWILLIIIVAAGTLNAFNFMDGINGMTGGYSLVAVMSLLYVNINVDSFISSEFLILFLLSLLVFNFFNFRNKAICFAGDVGSLTVAFIIIYLLIKLISETNQFVFILFLTLYGIDTIFTIVQRLRLRENIFEAHKLHLFQVIVSKTGLSHLQMSGLYMTVQMMVNVMVIYMINLQLLDQILISSVMLAGLSVTYIVIKIKLMK